MMLTELTENLNLPPLNLNLLSAREEHNTLFTSCFISVQHKHIKFWKFAGRPISFESYRAKLKSKKPHHALKPKFKIYDLNLPILCSE